MCKKYWIPLLGLIMAGSSFAAVKQSYQPQPPSPEEQANQQVLPENFLVYVQGTTVLNHPAPGFEEKLFPTVNLYKGNPGCYIACYSRHGEQAVYGFGDDIYVLGQVRVAGRYQGRGCVPTNFAGKDISAEEAFKTICSDQIKTCADHICWAGGDTGGWFGIQ